jgi:predicted RNase H-like nuclease
MLARQILGKRGSSVFSPPARCYLAVERFADTTGMSIQSYSIRGKIKELDDLMTPSLQHQIREAHPELSFARIAGHPMIFGKKSRAGKIERKHALSGLPGDPFLPFLENPRSVLRRERLSGVAVDDLLDACVMLWTAYQVAADAALRIPEPPPVDHRGLRMEMWAPR